MARRLCTRLGALLLSSDTPLAWKCTGSSKKPPCCRTSTCAHVRSSPQSHPDTSPIHISVCCISYFATSKNSLQNQACARTRAHWRVQMIKERRRRSYLQTDTLSALQRLCCYQQKAQHATCFFHGMSDSSLQSHHLRTLYIRLGLIHFLDKRADAWARGTKSDGTSSYSPVSRLANFTHSTG